LHLPHTPSFALKPSHHGSSGGAADASGTPPDSASAAAAADPSAAAVAMRTRSFNAGSSSSAVTPLPAGSYALPPSAEASIQAVMMQQQMSEKFMLDPVGSAHVSALRAIASNDSETLKSELKTMMQRYDVLKTTNATLLQKIQSLKGNIQVCCRARPPLPQEIKQGARVCVDILDNEIAWFDKRANLWKSFAFDRVWPMDSMQADVFSDIEPLALSVVDGFNACILAFGQTGSGKTFTMNGYGDQYGVSYRTMHKVFELLHFRRAQAFKDGERNRILAATRRGKDRSHSHHRSSEAASSKLAEGKAENEAALPAAGHNEEPAERTPEDAKSDSGERSLSESDSGSEESEVPEFDFSVSVSMLEIYNDMVSLPAYLMSYSSIFLVCRMTMFLSRHVEVSCLIVACF
jgi:hypothetical protein